MERSGWSVLTGALVALLGFALAGPALAANKVIVGTCNGATYATIQDGVDNVPSGGTVSVCPGTYAEQVTIDKPLTLAGQTQPSATVIVPPATGLATVASFALSPLLAAPELLIINTSGVKITDLTVDGTGNGITGCAPGLVGIMFQNASGAIFNIIAQNQKLTTLLEGCISGIGIMAESGNSGTSTLKVTNSTIQQYQVNGVYGAETGTVLNVTNNTITGQGSTLGAGESGVTFYEGATGNISGNSISENIWEPDTISDPLNAASGVLIYGAPKVQVSNNKIDENQFGVIVAPSDLSADGALVNSNTITNTVLFDGIDLCSNNNVASNNTIKQSSESGIHLDNSVICGGTGSDNFVGGNRINGACAGILLGTGTGNKVLGNNKISNVTYRTLPGNVCPPAI